MTHISGVLSAWLALFSVLEEGRSKSSGGWRSRRSKKRLAVASDRCGLLKAQSRTKAPRLGTPPVCVDGFCAGLSGPTVVSLYHCPRAVWPHVQKQQPRRVAIGYISKPWKLLQPATLNLHSLDLDWHQMPASSQNVSSWKTGFLGA
ncbi:unnamed protein product [Rangifer tarandus platyrhynchus]|uniref:Uncharacterized protein n=2 Tax=Rangifer tarandus platyrhynchus TaxID=3082113 RepID=A0AC60A612_RANTA|nr:unnamed protein product [Rangifer tarandus platyrhynchus]